MKHLIFIIAIFLSISAPAQRKQFSFTGEVTEKVKLTKNGTVYEIIETFNPPKSCEIILKPGILILKFDGKTETFYGIADGQKDEEGNVYFIASSIPDGDPEVMFLRSKDGDIMWLFLKGESQTATGFYLR